MRRLNESELPDTEPGVGAQRAHDRELQRRERQASRESGFEQIPRWGTLLGEKVDALGTKFDAGMARIEVIHGELVSRVAVQKKVISAAKVVAPSVAMYLIGRYPTLREPLAHLLSVFGLGL